MNQDNTFRIAVRRFAPFESAVMKIWNSFVEATGCALQLEMVSMDLPELHASILQNGGLAGGHWDVAHISTDWLFEGYASGALENLAPYISQKPPDDFPQGWSSSLLAMQQQGAGIYGLPFHDGPECLVYRKDLFSDPAEQKRYLEKYGATLEPPQTWDAFHRVAAYFQRPGENLYGSVFAGYPDGHNAVFDFCLQLWSRNGSLTGPAGRIDIDTPAALEGLTFYRAILQDGHAIHPQSAIYESVQAGLAFARGEAAMMVNWFGFAAMCEVMDGSAVKGKVDITTIPKGSDGRTASLNVYWLYAMGSGSKHKPVAWNFLRHAVSPENDKLVTLEGGIGCRLSTWKDAEINSLIPYYHKLETLHTDARTLPLKSNWAEIAAVIDEVVIKTVQTGMDIRTLLRQAQQRIALLQ